MSFCPRCLRCLRLRKCFGILEDNPEAESMREKLFTAICQGAPNLIDALLCGPREIDVQYLKNLWRSDPDGKVLRAISVALGFIGEQGELLPDLSLKSKQCLGHCVNEDLWRSVAYKYYIDFARQYCPEFVNDFDHLMKYDMFLTEYLRELIWIVVGMLLARWLSGQIVIIVL